LNTENFPNEFWVSMQGIPHSAPHFPKQQISHTAEAFVSKIFNLRLATDLLIVGAVTPKAHALAAPKPSV
jgi:hypothetical protein